MMEQKGQYFQNQNVSLIYLDCTHKATVAYCIEVKFLFCLIRITVNVPLRHVANVQLDLTNCDDKRQNPLHSS